MLSIALGLTIKAIVLVLALLTLARAEDEPSVTKVFTYSDKNTYAHLSLKHYLEISFENNTTKFTLTSLNKDFPKGLKVIDFSANGQYSFLSWEALSCISVYDNKTQLFGFLQFSEEQNLRFAATIPKTNITSKTNKPFYLGQNCSFMFVEGVIYKIQNQTLYQIKSPFLSSSFQISPSFMYLVSKGKLYRYNQSLYQYDLVYDLRSYTEQHYIAQRNKRIFISSHSVELKKQMTYILLDQNGTIILIGEQQYSLQFLFTYISFSLQLILTFDSKRANRLDIKLIDYSKKTIKNIDVSTEVQLKVLDHQYLQFGNAKH